MGARNVPDDWGCYQLHCVGCGGRYHASEGCDCGGGSEAKRTWLRDSGYEFDDGVWTVVVSYNVRLARRDHKDGTVKSGQWYSEYVFRHVCDDSGDSWTERKKTTTVPGLSLIQEKARRGLN